MDNLQQASHTSASVSNSNHLYVCAMCGRVRAPWPCYGGALSPLPPAWFQHQGQLRTLTVGAATSTSDDLLHHTKHRLQHWPRRGGAPRRVREELRPCSCESLSSSCLTLCSWTPSEEPCRPSVGVSWANKTVGQQWEGENAFIYCRKGHFLFNPLAKDLGITMMH